MNMDVVEQGKTARRLGILAICLAVVGGYTSQQLLSPILPKLSREIGLSEIQLGAILSTGFIFAALASPFWGKCSDRFGRKAVLQVSLGGAAIGLFLFAVSAYLVMADKIEPFTSFILFMLSRGLIFGTFFAGLPVSCQSYVSSITSRSTQRVSGISLMGACVGVGLVVGPGLGGIFGQYSIVMTLFGASVLLLVIFCLCWVLLPSVPTTKRSINSSSRVELTDPRLWPYLIVGACIYLSTGIFAIDIGFLVQDKLLIDPDQIAFTTGIILLAGGIPMLIVQGLIIPRLSPAPLALIKFGLPTAAFAFLLLAVSHSFPMMLVAAIISGVGHSLAIPGYMTAPTLHFSNSEQGGVAGLMNMVNSCAMIIGPILATGLYQISASTPFLFGCVLQFAVFGFCIAKISQTYSQYATEEVSDDPQEK